MTNLSIIKVLISIESGFFLSRHKNIGHVLSLIRLCKLLKFIKVSFITEAERSREKNLNSVKKTEKHFP